MLLLTSITLGAFDDNGPPAVCAGRLGDDAQVEALHQLGDLLHTHTVAASLEHEHEWQRTLHAGD